MSNQPYLATFINPCLIKPSFFFIIQNSQKFLGQALSAIHLVINKIERPQLQSRFTQMCTTGKCHVRSTEVQLNPSRNEDNAETIFLFHTCIFILAIIISMFQLLYPLPFFKHLLSFVNFLGISNIILYSAQCSQTIKFHM